MYAKLKVVLATTSLCLFGSLMAASAVANEGLERASQNPDQWVMPSGNYSAWRFSKLDQINTGNVKKMHVAWTMSTGALRGHEGQPLVVGDMMYFESAYPNYVYAVNLNDIGKIAWKFEPRKDPNAPPVACCDVVNRGVAYADNTIITDALDGMIYALNATNGKVIWKVRNADPKLGQTVTGAPLIIRDHVLVGVSGGEYGVLGYLTSYNLKTGKKEWRAYSAGPDSKMLFNPNKTINGATQKPVGRDSSLKTWKGDEWKVGGGTTWGWYSYDPKLNLVYYGTGNPGTWNPSQRPGDNKWSMSIIARNPDTGEAAWAYQMTPHDGWDYDGVNESVLISVDYHGHKTPAMVHFDRNGFAYVLDRVNGKLLAAHKYDPSVNWAYRINMKTGRPELDQKYMTKAGVNVKGICPSSQGDKDQQPISYDPNTGLVYAPLNHLCMDYQAFKVKYKAGFPFVGAIVNMHPGPGNYRGRFIAFDPMSGKTKWQIHDTFQDWGGALTTAGGIAFYGTLKGWFRAVDMKTGKVLYEFHCPSGIIGNPIAYMHDGKEYVAVLTGVGGWAAIGMTNNLHKSTAGLGAVGLNASLPQYTNLGGTLMVFAVN
ncbi:MAG: methanol/ethanol family PQQ-dependent dehydrogenase [Gammaproteobacteria bacterium]|jgi:PQQ-dependent dehydrogenase (methanol/ethanol family)